MNRIRINNNEIELLETDELIEVSMSDKLEIFDVRKINIKVLADTSLEIEYNNNESKMDIEYNIGSNIKFEVVETRKENKTKVQYKYNILENSSVDVLKFYDCLCVKELDIVNLNGMNSKINYNFKTISKDNQKYDLYIYHNNHNTESNIINNSVNIEEGNTTFNVTSVVYNGIKGCTLNQNNKIINLNDQECIINPNLLIEDNDTTANHSAFIGRFSEDEIFYLMSRGISLEDSVNLLIKGFLSDKITNQKILDIISSYWG